MRNVDNLPLSCAVVTKSGNLDFLEPSGPVQACNGNALLFFLIKTVLHFSHKRCVARLRAGRQRNCGSIPCKGKNYCFSPKISRPALVPK